MSSPCSPRNGRRADADSFLTPPRRNRTARGEAHDQTMKTLTLRTVESRRAASSVQYAAEVRKVAEHGYKLTCSTCDRQLHDHWGSPPDCEGFVRPVLSAEFAYADSLPLGASFRFLSRGGDGRVHILRREPVMLDDVSGLLELHTTQAGASVTTYLVEATTIVQLSTLSGPIAA